MSPGRTLGRARKDRDGSWLRGAPESTPWRYGDVFILEAATWIVHLLSLRR
jgi:hypothetical protein